MNKESQTSNIGLDKGSVSDNSDYDSDLGQNLDKLNLFTLNEILENWAGCAIVTKDENLFNSIKVVLDPKKFFTDNERKGETFYSGVDSNNNKHLLLGMSTFEKMKEKLESSYKIELPKCISMRKYTSVTSLQLGSSNFDFHFKKIYGLKNGKPDKKKEIKARLAEAQNLIKQRKTIEGRSYYLFSIDIEFYERSNSNCTLELGWSVYSSSKDMFYDRHIAISENEHLRNGEFVNDNRDRFMFGETVWLKESEAKRQLQLALNECGEDLILVGHGMKSDLKYLEVNGFTLKNRYKFDTEELSKTLDPNLEKVCNLGKTCSLLNINTEALHNAGNDAHFTLLAFMKICGYKFN